MSKRSKEITTSDSCPVGRTWSDDKSHHEYRLLDTLNGSNHYPFISNFYCIYCLGIKTVER